MEEKGRVFYPPFSFKAKELFDDIRNVGAVPASSRAHVLLFMDR
jgi:hypothetical protein